MAQKNPTVTMDEMVAGVRKHASEYYNINGWDYVVEAWDDAYLRELIGAARTVPGAIRKVGMMASTIASVREDVRNA